MSDSDSRASYDAVVVGGGFAGMAAALWLARYRRKVLVVDAGEPRNRWTEQAHGYLGLDPVDPGEVLRRGREELLRYPNTTIVDARVKSVTREGNEAFLLEANGGKFRARRVVLATGLADEFPDIQGFFEHYGASVFHCPSCDGYEAKGRKVVVFGWSEDVVGFALHLLNWAAQVTIVTDGRHFEGDERHEQALDRNRIALLTDEATELVGERGNLRGVRLRSGAVIDCDLAFFSIDHHPVNELALSLGCEMTDEGCVKIDVEGKTNVDGVYAAGDVTPGNQLIQVAAAQGTNAGIGCAKSLDDRIS